MSLIANVLGFGAFGFATRCLQLGIQKKHMFEGRFTSARNMLVGIPSELNERKLAAPQTHLIAMAAFGALGWGVYEMEGRQSVASPSPGWP